MKKQILIVTAAALTAAVVILSGTSAATAQQPQYQVGGFPITPLQMSVLQPSAKMREQPSRVSRSRSRQYGLLSAEVQLPTRTI
jgi:hypothetical protein